MKKKYFVIIIQCTDDDEYIPVIYGYDLLDDAKSKAYSEIGYQYATRALKKCTVLVIDENGGVLFSVNYTKEAASEA